MPVYFPFNLFFLYIYIYIYIFKLYMVPSDWSFNCRNPKRKNMSPHKHCELYISKVQLYSILLPYVFVFYIKYHRLQFPFSLVSKRLKYVLVCLLFCFSCNWVVVLDMYVQQHVYILYKYIYCTTIRIIYVLVTY